MMQIEKTNAMAKSGYEAWIERRKAKGLPVPREVSVVKKRKQ